jgi:hypothetical protein
VAEYISARNAILREIESAQAALKGAQQSYNEEERKLHEAQRRTSSAYEGRARNQRNVDRLKKALAVLDEGASDER